MKPQIKNNNLTVPVILAIFFLFPAHQYSQSVLTLGPGTSMGVLTGSNLCVNVINGPGALYGGGTICGNLVAIEPVGSTEVPQEFSLMQNYPNPFNPVTNIGLSISDFGFVSLKVYDITGREIAILVNQELKPGIYNVDFDASQFSSGTYFYRIEIRQAAMPEGRQESLTGGFTDVKKMVILK